MKTCFRKTTLITLALAAAATWSVQAGKTFTVMKSADGTDAWVPMGKLASDGGFLYGASVYGGTNSGNIFRFDPTTASLFTVHSFAGGANGAGPSSGVIHASNGYLYGTTNQGGANGQGILFRVQKTGSNFSILRSFANNASGGFCASGVIEGSDNKIYGISENGGANSFGGIFRINLDGTSHSLLRSFTGTGGATRGKGNGADGLIEIPGGFLYGTTESGGTSDRGVFFQMSKDGVTYNVFREWPSTGLNRPRNRLLYGSDGFFYGAAGSGGAADRGGIYRISPSGDYTELHEFTNSTDGFNVNQALIEGSDGYLYGVAQTSSNGLGSLFRMAKDGSSFAVVHRFKSDQSEGELLDAPLVETSAGVFVSAARNGGVSGDGTFYRLETTLEKPTVAIRGKKRIRFTGSSFRLRGSAIDDIELKRVEYTTRNAFRTVQGTSTWSTRVRVKPSVKRVTVKVRSLDHDELISDFAVVRAVRE
jgi:uncharacterized repeat protein (TIGR03803 family)